MHDLMKNLIDSKQNINSLLNSISVKLGDIFEFLNGIPMIDILKLIDIERAHKIFTWIDKIVSLAQVCQSIGIFFTRDDAIDPAITVCKPRGEILILSTF